MESKSATKDQQGIPECLDRGDMGLLRRMKTFLSTIFYSTRNYLLGTSKQIHRLIMLPKPPDGLVVVSYVWPQFGKRSGYHLISENLGMEALRFCSLLPKWLLNLLAKTLNDEYLEARISIWLTCLMSGTDSLLVLYGDVERTLIKMRLPRWKPLKRYAVFHEPNHDLVGFYLKDIPPSLLTGAFCVSRTQVPVLENHFGKGKVHFLPHGIDTEHFKPLDVERDSNLVLSVGCHWRDFETLLAAARLIKAKRPETTICLVGQMKLIPDEIQQAGDLISVKSGVSDEELKALYSSASVTLLCLEGSTANNALLESMACGTPVVATDVGGVKDYGSSQSVIFCEPGDADQHAQGVLKLLKNPELCKAMGMAAREKSLEFAWPKITNQLRDRIRGDKLL